MDPITKKPDAVVHYVRPDQRSYEALGFKFEPYNASPELIASGSKHAANNLVSVTFPEGWRVGETIPLPFVPKTSLHITEVVDENNGLKAEITTHQWYNSGWDLTGLRVGIDLVNSVEK